MMQWTSNHDCCSGVHDVSSHKEFNIKPKKKWRRVKGEDYQIRNRYISYIQKQVMEFPSSTKQKEGCLFCYREGVHIYIYEYMSLCFYKTNGPKRPHFISNGNHGL